MTVREGVVGSERGIILLRAHHACVHGGNIAPPSALGVRGDCEGYRSPEYGIGMNLVPFPMLHAVYTR